MVLAAAFLGWMFDGLEMGIFPVVLGPPSRKSLHPGRSVGGPGWVTSPPCSSWARRAAVWFLVGWATRSARARDDGEHPHLFAVHRRVLLRQAAWQLGVFRFLAALDGR